MKTYKKKANEEKKEKMKKGKLLESQHNYDEDKKLILEFVEIMAKRRDNYEETYERVVSRFFESDEFKKERKELNIEEDSDIFEDEVVIHFVIRILGQKAIVEPEALKMLEEMYQAGSRNEEREVNETYEKIIYQKFIDEIRIELGRIKIESEDIEIRIDAIRSLLDLPIKSAHDITRSIKGVEALEEVIGERRETAEDERKLRKFIKDINQMDTTVTEEEIREVAKILGKSNKIN
jgi:hypothetical protein